MASDPVYVEIALRLVVALALGSAIGIERTHRGRPAGFRTHALVGLSTCMLMLLSVYETRWFPEVSQGRVTIDPTRMAQGIMTGIGFLGSGVIMREGFTVRGLTTAASIWITAALGVLVGIGFWFPSLLGAMLTLGTLALFRWVEDRIPTPLHYRVVVRFSQTSTPGDQSLAEQGLRQALSSMGLAVVSTAYRVDSAENFFEYRMIVRAWDTAGAVIARKLSEMAGVAEFRVEPTAD